MKRILLIVLMAILFSSGIKFCMAAVLFEDSFNGNNLNNWDISTGAWSIENGELHGVGAGGQVDAWIYAGDKNWTDYSFETKTNFINGNAELAFRSTDHWVNEYRFTLFSQDSPYMPNNFILARYKNGIYTGLTTNTYGDLLPVLITENSNVKISILGDTIDLFVNGGKIFECHDSDPLNNGRIGLGVIWEWQGNFDDVIVSDSSVVPEPATLSLLGLGLFGLVFKRKKNS